MKVPRLSDLNQWSLTNLGQMCCFYYLLDEITNLRLLTCYLLCHTNTKLWVFYSMLHKSWDLWKKIAGIKYTISSPEWVKGLLFLLDGSSALSNVLVSLLLLLQIPEMSQLKERIEFRVLWFHFGFLKNRTPWQEMHDGAKLVTACYLENRVGDMPEATFWPFWACPQWHNPLQVGQTS